MQDSNSRLMTGLGVFALGVSMTYASSTTPANAATSGYQPQGQSSSHSIQHGASSSAQPYRGQSSASAATPRYQPQGQPSSPAMQHGSSAASQPYGGQSSASAVTPAYHSQGQSHSYSRQHGDSASGQSPEGQPATQSNPNQPPVKAS
jgi:hypothetical protein